jgi:hypothetical protein
MMNLRSKLSILAVFLIFVVSLSSCDLLPFGGGVDDSVSDADQSQEQTTETQTPTPFDSPTITLTSTETPIPSATLSPTIRPTWTPFPTKTLRPTWTASPTLSPTATKEVGWIIKDDFSKVTDAWYMSSGGNWEMGYARGGYYMSVLENNVEITSSQSWLKIDDTRVIVDVYKENGKGYWGISCRETVASSYYTIFITSDGDYGYGETRTGRVDLKIMGNSKEILTGHREVNQIMAECRGNHLRLFVNGEFIFQVEVKGIGPGWVGMMVGTMYEQEKVTVIFDNIEIWGPIDYGEE